MQALLDDLAKADSLYSKMYESSVNSSGSAMSENEEYMKSLQARLNLMRVEFEKLALAMGDAFLSESMIGAIKLFSDMLGLATKVTEEIGALPVMFGLVGVAVTTLSSKFRALILSLGTGSWSVLRGEITATTLATKA